MLENRDGFYDVSSWDRNVGEEVDQTFNYSIQPLVDTAQIYSVRDLQRCGSERANDRRLLPKVQ